MLEPGGYEGFDLIHGITEAAGLGDITLLGKIVDKVLPSYTATGRLNRIPASYWIDHEIDPMTCFNFSNNGLVLGLGGENQKTQTQHDGGHPISSTEYADLHLETDGLMD